MNAAPSTSALANDSHDWKLDSNRWFPARWKTVRVGYPAKYFGGMPRYATIPMQNLRSPNDQGI